ncbi:MAG: amidohydrolase family protein [Gammaproteobacteria bacterium]
MKMDDMILVSVDDHLIEPRDLFEKHVPAAWRDRAPKVVTLPDGAERWVFEGRMMATVGSAAVSGRSREERCLEAANFSHMRAGCYDPRARCDDMSANGVLTSLCFGTLTGFAGELFHKGQDKALMHVLLQAYNDWHIDEWCATAPGRFIPIGIVPLWDADLALAEVRRLASKGVKAICFPENCASLGMKTIHEGYWDPVFAACCDAGLPLCIHIGTGGGFRIPSLQSPADVSLCTMNITLADCMADILFSGLFNRFPALRIALSEGYLGWVPFFKERCDYVYEMHRFWTGADFGADKPSDLIRRHFLLCFTEDEAGVRERHQIGIETMTWECDYPHADSTWPTSPERLWRSLQHLPDAEIDLITHGNAMRFFDFDPFVSVPRERASVGALRADARHVDVRPVSGLGGYTPKFSLGRKHLTAADLMALAKQMDLGIIDSKVSTGPA